jgi:hypothetical protein
MLEQCIKQGETTDKIIENIDNFEITDIFTKYSTYINNLKYNYYNSYNNKTEDEMAITIDNKDLNNLFLDLILLVNTKSTDLLDKIYNKLMNFCTIVPNKNKIKQNLGQIENIVYKAILDSNIEEDSAEKTRLYIQAIKLYNSKEISRETFYKALINCEKEEKMYLDTIEALTDILEIDS